jgi:hypothetical protein
LRPNPIARYKYHVLLLAILLLLVAHPVLRGPAGSPVLFKVLFTAVLLAGGLVVFADRRRRVLSMSMWVFTPSQP